MKKRIASYFLLIAALAGCSQNYNAEKEFWKAQKVLNSIKNSDVQAKGPEVFDPAIEAFKRVADQYPSTNKAAESLFVSANLYIRQKKYDLAQQSLEKIVQNFSDRSDKSPEARYGIAGIAEVQGNWKKAEIGYWETAEYHPYHQKGLYAPVHVVLHYKKVKDKEGLEVAYQKAVDYYNRMVKQTGPIQASSAISNYLALTHLGAGRWKQAREVWNEIPNKFLDSGYAPMAMLASAELSWKRKDLDTAVQTYQEYLKKYPKHNLVKRSQVQLAMVLVQQKKYSQAREFFNSALIDEKNIETQSDIQMMIAKSYQEEGNWNEADRIYKEIESSYKNSNAALQVPFMRAAYLKGKGETAQANQLFDAAIIYYEELKQSTNLRLADYALRLQNAAYAEKGDWKKVIENFDNKISTEKNAARKGSWIFLKALVTESKLNDKSGAQALYAKFLQEFPGHPHAAAAKTRQELILKKA